MRRVLLAFLACMATLMMFETFVHAAYPLATGRLADAIESANVLRIRKAIGFVPLSAKLLLTASWFVAPFIGALVASAGRWGRRANVAWAVGVAFALLNLVNLSSLPHPMWMNVAGATLWLPATWLGRKFGTSGA
ncbi:MAG: hypothetical protein RLZZ383_2992 [Pseudomonadota bacterium]|jgi:hypothetical protein